MSAGKGIIALVLLAAALTGCAPPSPPEPPSPSSSTPPPLPEPGNEWAVHDSWPVGNGQPQTIEGVSCDGPYGPWHLVLGGDLAAFGLVSLDAYYETTIDPTTMTGPVTGVEHSVTTDGQSYDGGSTGTATLTEADGGYLMSFELDYSVHWTHPPEIYSPEGDELTGHISRNADVTAATEADCP